jgi:hypothetical protein
LIGSAFGTFTEGCQRTISAISESTPLKATVRTLRLAQLPMHHELAKPLVPDSVDRVEYALPGLELPPQSTICRLAKAPTVCPRPRVAPEVDR